MDIEATERARARFALHQLCRTHLYDPNVTLIDVGFKSREGQLDRNHLALRVHVAQKFSPAELELSAGGRATAPVPRFVNGFATDVLEGTYHNHLVPNGPGRRPVANPRLSRCDPLKGGISVGRSGSYGAGTLGGVVIDRASGEPMLLSNWHVLVANWAARPGVAIYQPASLDGGGANDLVAWYARDAMAVNLDAAVAFIEDTRQATALQLGIGPVRGSGQPAHGLTVLKSGRTTGVTRGEITGMDGVMTMRYGGLTRVIRHIVTIDPPHENDVLSAAGDSGSLYLDEDTGACVALHFAGSDQPERALAIDINPVAEALAVDFPNG